MLTKILITILVILSALMYLRRGRSPKTSYNTKTIEIEKPPLLSKIAIYAMIALSMLATAGYWGWGWYDDNTIVEVTISSPIEAMTASYKVRKKDIHEQRITTVDGVHIRLSNQERLTVEPLVKQ